MIATNRIAIYGGTFDPIHIGHIHLIDWLIESKEFAQVIVVPSGSPWQRKPEASPGARFQMVGLALADRISSGVVEISDCELDRVGSYALETVRRLKASYPSSDLIWIIGSDAFAGISNWWQVQELAQLVEFLVIHRPGSEVVAPPSFIRWREREIAALDISASEIRKQIKSGKSISGLVPESVIRYIKENALYVAS